MELGMSWRVTIMIYKTRFSNSNGGLHLSDVGCLEPFHLELVLMRNPHLAGALNHKFIIRGSTIIIELPLVGIVEDL